MTMAEFQAAMDGFIRAHTTKDESPSDDEFARVLAEEIAAGRA